jgi:outer membrane protein assembly factor BamB
MEFLMKTMSKLLILAVLIVLTGCGRQYKMHRREIGQHAPWTFYRGKVAADGFVDGTFSGSLNEVWKTRVRGKPAGPLALTNQALVFPGTRKRVEFIDRLSGAKLGHVKIKGYPQTGALIRDSLMFCSLAPRRDKLYAINLFSGKTVWSRPVKEAASGSIILNSSLIVSSAPGVLLAANVADGSTDWQAEVGARCSAPASAAHGLIFQPVDGRELVALSDADGSEVYRVSLKAAIVSAAAIGRLVYVADLQGNVYGVEPTTGEILWTETVNGPVWSPPAVTDKRVFVGHSGGEVVAFDAVTGKQLWVFAANKVIKASPLALGSFVVVGTTAGTLFVLDAESGRVVDETTVDGSIETAPVSDGERLMVATEKGRITCFGDPYEQDSAADHREHSQN